MNKLKLTGLHWCKTSQLIRGFLISFFFQCLHNTDFPAEVMMGPCSRSYDIDFLLYHLAPFFLPIPNVLSFLHFSLFFWRQVHHPLKVPCQIYVLSISLCFHLPMCSRFSCPSFVIPLLFFCHTFVSFVMSLLFLGHMLDYLSSTHHCIHRIYLNMFWFVAYVFCYFVNIYYVRVWDA